MYSAIDENLSKPKTHYDKEERALINRILEYKGEKHTLSEWGRILGKKGNLFKSRIDAGWSVEEAMETPYYHSRRKAKANE